MMKQVSMESDQGILENRWMRKKVQPCERFERLEKVWVWGDARHVHFVSGEAAQVPSVDRKILLDWKSRSQQLKAPAAPVAPIRIESVLV